MINVIVSSVVLFGALLAALVASLVVLLRALSDRAVCDFRTSLWRVHDDIVDDLVAKRLEDPDRARALLVSVRSFIAHAPDLTALRVFGGYALIRIGSSARATLAMADTFDPGWDGEAESAIEVYRTRVAVAATDHLFRSSLGGRLASLVVPLLFAIGRVVGQRSSEGTRLIDPAEDLAIKPLRVEVSIENFIDQHHAPTLLASRAC